MEASFRVANENVALICTEGKFRVNIHFNLSKAIFIEVWRDAIPYLSFIKTQNKLFLNQRRK